jgi:hypothetical protein
MVWASAVQLNLFKKLTHSGTAVTPQYWLILQRPVFVCWCSTTAVLAQDGLPVRRKGWHICSPGVGESFTKSRRVRARRSSGDIAVSDLNSGGNRCR